jgi:hypothetical protein
MFGALGVIAALGIGGGAYAATSASGPSTPAASDGTTTALIQSATGSGGSSGVAAGPAARMRWRALLRRTDHASLEAKVKGQWVTYNVDRGSVSAVSPTSISIARPDGQKVTFTVGPSTRYRGVSSESAIQVGHPAVVVSENGAALGIGQAAAKPKAGTTAA